jgi:hypothetical protein
MPVKYSPSSAVLMIVFFMLTMPRGREPGIPSGPGVSSNIPTLY